MFRAQIAAPTHIARLSALGMAVAGAALFAIAKPALEVPAQQGAPTIALTSSIDVPLDVPVAVQTEAPPIAVISSRSISMVFEAQGASWMKLENLAVLGERTDNDGIPRARIPKHGPTTYTREDYTEVAIAPIALADVPAAYRDRLGDKVIVDGTCTAYITGFSVVSRLTGSPGYAGDDTSETWTTDMVMQYGAPILAAKLDRCTGKLARDGALPPAAEARLENHADVTLVAEAKRLLLASPDAFATTQEWHDHYKDDSKWSTHHATTWKTQMFVHPTTHETWISIHANQMEGCGSPQVNVWGLYRVNADRTLTSIEVDLRDIVNIEQLIDLDGDGMFEVVGTAWLGDRLVNDVKGTTLETLYTPFYGCPC